MKRFYLLISVGLLLGSCQKETTQPQQTVQVSEEKLFSYGGILDEANSYYWLDILPTGLKATVVLDKQPHILNVMQAIEKGKNIPVISLTDGNVTLHYAYDYTGGMPSIRISTSRRTLTNTIGTLYSYRIPETVQKADPVALYTGTYILSDCPAAGAFIYNMALDYSSKKYAILYKRKDNPAAETVSLEGYFWDTPKAIELGGDNPWMTYSFEYESSVDLLKQGTDLVYNLTAEQAQGQCAVRIDLQKH